MPYIKDTMSILAECAAMDLGTSKTSVIKESEVRSSYSSIEEASEEFTIGGEMVPVFRVGEDLLTEANLLAPYMRSNNIKSIAEALDNVAEANGLAKHSVGLMIESQECVTDMIEKACEKAKSTGNNKVKDAVLSKVDKATDLVDKLKKSGYPVKKKKSNKK